ncbi:MAG: hypothetical protein HYV26_11935 [Candidatus Hydrogenedentes bacterium]|nr:hypothetical protein [Candidatus Hydrogenedentota bacterium]
MRIISDYKDYYDSVQTFGADPALVYVRKREQFEFRKRHTILEERKPHLPDDLDRILAFPLDLLSRLPREVVQKIGKWQRKDFEMPVTTKLVGFCGNLYPALEMEGKTFYCTEDLPSNLPTAYLKRFGLSPGLFAEVLAQNYKPSHGWGWRQIPLTHANWHAAAAEVAGKTFDEVFVELGLPIFLLEYITEYVAKHQPHKDDLIRCTLNPHLKEERFQQVKGPAETFQEIAMYLGNQLARQPDPMSNIPDDIMRDEKGFDQWSFRRHKEEDKKLRKKRRT